MNVRKIARQKRALVRLKTHKLPARYVNDNDLALAWYKRVEQEIETLESRVK